MEKSKTCQENVPNMPAKPENRRKANGYDTRDKLVQATTYTGQSIDKLGTAVTLASDPNMKVLMAQILTDINKAHKLMNDALTNGK